MVIIVTNVTLCCSIMYLVFTLVFRPMRMPEIQIICLFILYKPRTVLSILVFIWKRAPFYVLVLCPSSKSRVNTKSVRG